MNHNKIVLFLKLGFFWSLLIIFMFFVFKLIDVLAPEPIEISLKTLTPIIIIITTAFTIFAYNQLKNQIHAIEYDVEGISKKFLLFDYLFYSITFIFNHTWYINIYSFHSLQNSITCNIGTFDF